MSKKPKQSDAFSCPVEKLAYLTPFRLKPDDHQIWIIIDFHEQSTTADGELCHDKPIKVRSNTGNVKGLAWGTKVFPTNQPVVKEEPIQETNDA